MTQQTIKDRFHQLIEQIEDEALLKEIYEMVYQQADQKGDFWHSLTAEQQADLKNALKETEDESNLVDNDTVLTNARKWLKK